MSIIYNVTIESSKKHNLFQIKWHNPERNTQDSFYQETEISPEETERLWQIPRFQLTIGQKLFNLLDGKTCRFRQALNRANFQGEKLQVNLYTCKQTADWPFELLAKDGRFLLPHQIHLVRCVSTGRGIERAMTPQNRHLKVLFMACSALDVKPELDFEQEEEAIFHITEKLAMDMDVEDTGSLEGLRGQLEQEQYDVVHLSGHAGIDKEGRPYFIMEDETGCKYPVFPHKLWNEALIKNPPQLLFLSGCRTGEVPDEPDGTDAVSFARLLVENYHVPTVLAWGRPVNDEQAIHAGKMIFHELSRGKSILEAVQRARFELIEDFPTSDKPAWPLLRLFRSRAVLGAIVTEGRRYRPKPRRMKHVFLENSQVKVLAEGFVGRRRQLQISLRTLKHDFDKVGVLLLGTGGLGKSCLAGKICERFPDFTLIIVHGRFNTITLESALTDAFIASQDEKGQEILSQKEEMKKKIAKLCTAGFKEKNYLLLLDDFEQNLEGSDKGQPGALLPESEDLLEALLQYLPKSDKMTQLLITSRYEFSLCEQERDLVKERLEKVWLTGFRGAEQRKKVRTLKNIMNYPAQLPASRFLAAGHGNPRLMEWIDTLVGRMTAAEVPRLLEAVKNKQEDFIREHVIRELLQRGGKKLEIFLRCTSIYRRPVQAEGVKVVAEKTGFPGWKELLKKGMSVSLIEHDQARRSYRVTPLLREEFLKSLEEIDDCHKAAFVYYKKACEGSGSIEQVPVKNYKKLMEIRDGLDPVLTEEWVYHALGCGEEGHASRQGGLLIFYLLERTAFREALRIGLWIMAEKKQELSRGEDALVLEGISASYQALGENPKASDYSRQAASLLRTAFGKYNFAEAVALNCEGDVSSDLADYTNAAESLRQALPIIQNSLGEADLMGAMTMNNLARALCGRGEYREAIRHLKKALTIIRNNFGDMPGPLAATLSNLASAHESLGEYPKAIDYYRQALDLARKCYSENDPRLSAIMNNLGSLYNTIGDHRRAAGYIEQALSIDRTLFDGDHPVMASKLCNLGAAYFVQADYPRAIHYYEQALAIWRKAYDRDHPDIGLVMNNLGEAWRGLGDTNKAVEYYREALSIKESVLGKEHPDNVPALVNLGVFFYQQGDYPGAVVYYEQALAICKKAYGKTHPMIATVLNNLGEIWRVTGKTEKAIEYLQKSLEMSKACFGDKHHETAASLNNLGSVYRDLGHHQQAVDFYEQALVLWREAYGETHPEVANVLYNLGIVRGNKGEHEKAVDYYQRALGALKEIHGEKHAHVAYVLNKMAFSFLALSDYQSVIKYAGQALPVNLSLYGEQHPETADSLIYLGLGHRCLGNHLDAIEYLGRVLAVSRERYGEENTEVSTTMAHLGMVYLEKGDPEKAEGYLEKAYEINNKLLGSEHPNTKDIYQALKACREE